VIWKTVKLGDVCTITNGSTPLRKEKLYWEEGNVPWFTIDDFRLQGKNITYTQQNVTQAAVDDKKVRLVPANSVLLCCTASIGEAAIARVEMATNQQFNALTPKSAVLNSDYLYFVATTLTQTLLSLSGSTTINFISMGKLKEISIPLPSLAEQERIVAKLDAAFAEIDRAIEAAGKSGEKLKEQQTLHTETIFNETCSPFKKIVLGDVCDGVQYGTSSKCSKTGKYPVLRMGNIQNGAFDVSDLVYLDDEIEAKKYELNKGDVLFNRTNSSVHVGKTGVFDEVDDYLFAGYLIKVNYLKEKVIPEFLSYYLNSRKIREYGFSVMSESINQSNINGTKLKNYPFYEVPLEAQKSATQKISDLNRASDEAINLYGKKVKALIKLKSALLATELQSEAA
jgi:type I restriction enzyme, S subunit